MYKLARNEINLFQNLAEIVIVKNMCETFKNNL